MCDTSSVFEQHAAFYSTRCSASWQQTRPVKTEESKSTIY